MYRLQIVGRTTEHKVPYIVFDRTCETRLQCLQSFYYFHEKSMRKLGYRKPMHNDEAKLFELLMQLAKDRNFKVNRGEV